MRYDHESKTLTDFAAHSLYAFRNFKRLGEFRVDISALPVTKKIAPGDPQRVFIIGFVSIMAAAALYRLMLRYGMPYMPVRQVYDVPVERIAYWLVYIVAAGFGFGIYACFNNRVVTFERLDLNVTEPDGSTWRSGYRHFVGIRERREVFDLRMRARQFRAPFGIVELVHKDCAKSILLFASTTEMTASMPTQDYATIFRLPVLPEDYES